MQDYSKYRNEEIKFTCAVLSISSTPSLTFTYMWSKGVIALSIHVTGVISFTLVNIWETVDAFCTLILSPYFDCNSFNHFKQYEKSILLFVFNKLASDFLKRVT